MWAGKLNNELKLRKRQKGGAADSAGLLYVQPRNEHKGDFYDALHDLGEMIQCPKRKSVIEKRKSVAKQSQ